ncbi:MAG: ATPase domain-containing protein [Ignisphaera sp.]
MGFEKSDVAGFVFKDEIIADLLGDIEPGSVLLVLGHPGAGKSTFAAGILFENCLRFNVKGVYISLAETREKFYNYMKKFSMDFEYGEKKNLVEFIHMPTLAGRELLEAITSTLSTKIFTEGCSIAVVDSITPILNVLTTDEARSYLHSTLYNLSSVAKALLILIADLPFATETVDLKGLEFIADAVFVFKTRIEKRMISRFMEVRKFRGKSIPMAEIPFVIEEGRGIRCLLSPTIAEVPYSMAMTSYRDECTNSVWGSILSGTYVGIVSRCNIIPFSIWLLLTKLIMNYGLNYGILSFRESKEVTKEVISKSAQALGTPPHYILQKSVFIESLNPSIFSSQQLEAMFYRFAEQNINFFIIDGAEALYLHHDPLYVDQMLRSLSTYIKNGLITVFELINGVYTQTQTSRYDIVHEIICRENTVEHNVVRGRIAAIDIASYNLVTRISEESILKCLNIVQR